MLVVMTFMLSGVPAYSQAIDPQKSARAAANSDVEFIAANIENNEDMIFLSQKAVDRTRDERVKELAQQMTTDHTQMFYSFQQLASAGKGTTKKKSVINAESHLLAGKFNSQIASTAAADFDSVWIAGMINLRQPKYDELLQAKETVMNPQIKMAIADALALIKKHLSQLRSIQKYLARNAAQLRREEAMRKKEQEALRKNR